MSVKYSDKKISENDVHALLDIFHKWLHFENDTDVTIPMSFAVSNYTKTDPGCLGIIAPSGSYKTELIRALGDSENEYIYPLDNLTSHTFVSGMKDVDDVIPDLKQRLITIKDFTTLLSKREDERTAIFSDIREMLDGYFTRKFGSGKQVTYTDIHSSILFGSTRAIEGYYSLNATLGQRMLFFKPKNNPTKARKRAFKNMNRTGEMRNELHDTTLKFLNKILKNSHDSLNNIGVDINEHIIDTLGAYADFVALARTHIRKDYKGEIAEEPDPEFPTRLFKEIIKIISCHAILYDREITQEDVRAGISVLISNIPDERVRLLKELIKKQEEGFSSSELSVALHLSSGVTRKGLEGLLILGIIDREPKAGRTGDIYTIKTDCRIVVEHLFNYDISLFVWGGNRDMYRLRNNNGCKEDNSNSLLNTPLTGNPHHTKNVTLCEMCANSSQLVVIF